MPESDFIPKPLSDNERLALASDWSDYRKDYGVSADDDRLRADHQVFGLAWRAGRDHERRTHDANAFAPLALVEATERLAKAQETANLIAYIQGVESSFRETVNSPNPPSPERSMEAFKLIMEQSNEIRRRLGIPVGGA